MKRASSADTTPGVGASLDDAHGRRQAAPLQDRGGLTLWLWVAAGFLLLALAWAVMFTAAREANVESVPLVTKGGRP